MVDLTIELDDRPGALAEMGEALGRAGVSVEGGGAWVVDGTGTAHFLFQDGKAARSALEAAGIRVLEVREVLVQRLRQDQPGQLGKLTRRMADAGVNIQTLYSDHDHQMVLTVDDLVRGGEVSTKWESVRLAAQPSTAHKTHHYATQMEWTGNDGDGTRTYRSYRRDFTISSTGKPLLLGSSDPAFRGDASRYNPEEMLVAALSSCHMLWYLHLCSSNGVRVLAYRDEASGVMTEDAAGLGRFTSVRLAPAVRISADSDRGKALSLHHEAHAMCYIARSVNFPVAVEPSLI
jgi:organic hydroperoxide reductase OsmC/OhrA